MLAALGASVPVQAQTTVHGAIKWGGYAEVPSTGTRRQKVPTFAEARVAFDDQVGWYTLRLRGAATQGELLNLVYEPFEPADARLFNAAKLPAGPEPHLTTGTEMKLPVTYLSVRPARRNPQTGQPERLVAFDYRYEPVAARTTANTAHVYGPSSVLSSGDWFKIGVAESGIYKLDKTTLSKMGLNVATLNPNNFHLYGNSMGILPQPNATPRPDDLAENNILFVSSNNNNVLDDDEYFLFYSPGAHTWEAQGGMFRHRNNIYTDTTYYFVGANSRAGLRVPTVAALPATGASTVSTFTYRAFYEHDLANLLHSGRMWVGEGFRAGGQQDITLAGIPDLVTTTPVRVYTAVLASSATNSSFQATLNGTALGSLTLGARPTCDYCAVATTSQSILQATLANTGNDLKVGLTYNSSDASAAGYLDYLDLNAERQLRMNGAQLEFRTLANIGAGARNRYVLTGTTAATQVWDVTNPRRPLARPLDAGAVVAPADTVREFVALERGGAFAVPRAFGKVPNQNLHALNLDQRLDLVIVTAPVFRAQAQRLADYRALHDNLRAAVVTTSEIYNEYGSGGQDVTAIRDFMKQIYQRASPGKHLQLLLFGDASFDYKSDPYNNKDFEPTWWRDRVPFKSDADFDKANQNYVPTYESRESLTAFGGTSSYSSDDYYALLDDDEGEWNEITPGTELLDIGVGRLPVRQPKGELTNTDQARTMVDKVKSYDADAAFGKWRNRITLVSDDGNNDLFVGAGSELIADIIQTNHPAYNVHKVYLDLYPQLSVAAGQRSPQCNQAIDQSVEQGSLIINYLGHGGPKGWADEQIVSNASVMALRNVNNLTFFTTGTCDFSTYDNPDFTSAGEQLLTDNISGGAIGLFTTTRVVEAGANAELNKAYFNRVLQPLSTGQYPAIGTAIMTSKNAYPGLGQPGVINNRNYSLLADPSMTLAYPRQTVELDSIRRRNPKGAWVTADTLLALSRVRLHGKVLNGGALNTNFTGRAQVIIYDKPTTVMTLGDEVGKAYSGPDDAPRPVVVQESVIYGGQAEVVNGQFSLSFVVPKDINYSVGVGKISLYAFDTGHDVDANGYQVPKVGGAYKGAPTDTKPPEINLFMDSEQFAFGGLTAQNTTLLARLQDESGINTTGAGIGHDITAIIDRDPSKLLVLNDTYVASVGDFTTGRVNNPYKDLAPGPHTITLKAWDTYNNSAERTVEFVVAHDEKLALDHVLNYPNPFAHHTTFFFEHNQAGAEPDNLDVQVQIFTVAGHLVRTLNTSVATTDGYSRSLSWDGRDDFDDPLAKGVYVYRLTVRSQRTQSVASKYEKLVILN
ncbi:type IX secretion system sortase PorU [Hymenobacter agri]